MPTYNQTVKQVKIQFPKPVYVTEFSNGNLKPVMSDGATDKWDAMQDSYLLARQGWPCAYTREVCRQGRTSPGHDARTVTRLKMPLGLGGGKARVVYPGTFSTKEGTVRRPPCTPSDPLTPERELDLFY